MRVLLSKWIQGHHHNSDNFHNSVRTNSVQVGGDILTSKNVLLVCQSSTVFRILLLKPDTAVTNKIKIESLFANSVLKCYKNNYNGISNVSIMKGGPRQLCFSGGHFTRGLLGAHRSSP